MAHQGEILNNVHDEANRLLRTSGGQNFDEISQIVNEDYPEIQYLFVDDFNLGFQGWQYQYDTTGRTGVTLTEEARKGNYGLLMHTKKAASAQAWTRKGVRVPDNATKVVFGCYWMFHAINANNPGSLNFDLDFQTASGTNRHYCRFQYLNHDGTTLQQKWRVNTGTPTSQSFTDVTSGAMSIPWNESDKPMLNYMVGVYDLETKKYEKLYSNGNTYTISTQDIGTTAGTSLSNFDKGAVNIYIVESRSNATEESLFSIEKPFLGYIF